MGQPTPHPPAILLLAAFSRYPQALAWARQRAEAAWGPVVAASEVFEFRETDYYEATMGPELEKVFFAFGGPFDPAELASVKRTTNRWEEEFAARRPGPELRPLNLDPGYLTAAKLVLASTKDHAHRIYLGRGIFAEVTLAFRHGAWQSHPWTYRDYRRDDYQHFFTRLRDRLRRTHEGDRPP